MDSAKTTETELKLLIADLRAVRARLENLGASQLHARQHETNLRYDFQDRTLEREKMALRLRKDSRARLTFKGPSRLVEGALHRTELEVGVDDHETTARLLEALGFQVTVQYEKYRTTYAYRDCEVMLDELPIGDFIEIEGHEAERLVAIAVELALDPGRAIASSYVELFSTISQNRGYDPVHLTFDAFRGKKVQLEAIGVLPADRA